MRRYLLVDDNLAFAENLAEIIADSGAEAVVVSSGERALALLQQQRFDALVSDMRMPGMSGVELVHRLRRTDPALPAVVVTAYTSDRELAAARREGLLGVLGKPVPISSLLELLAGARRNGIVAVVEDDVALADNLTEALGERGFATVTAGSVADTERLEVRPFAAIVDLRLPGGVDGAAMRQLEAKFPGLPVLIVSAYVESTPLPAQAAVFAKPFDTGKLLEAVEQLHARMTADG